MDYPPTIKGQLERYSASREYSAAQVEKWLKSKTLVGGRASLMQDAVGGFIEATHICRKLNELQSRFLSAKNQSDSDIARHAIKELEASTLRAALGQESFENDSTHTSRNLYHQILHLIAKGT